ncbi:ABC transporter permease [Rothia sp. P5766]|uniref:ABC transporter permease n=1 Tax=unclassified Rothia (in: high G+C Gram-positive bacteria) TaxID=2689056 RepID=UPI003AD2F526
MQLLRFMGYDLKHSLMNFSSFFYLLLMPVGFYLLFGAMQDYSHMAFRDGDAAAYVMLGMAVYGAVVGAVSSAGNAVIEIESGWGRQLALTPITSRQLLATKTVNALVTTALPVLCVNLTALLTQASIPLGQQVACALVTLAVSAIFVAYGSLIARLFKNARAVSVASGLLVFFSFFGTTFSPLSTDLLAVARFTPLYGVTQLSRYFFTRGDTVTTDPNTWFVTEPVSYALLNLAFWGAVFMVGNWLLRKRVHSR